MNWLCILQHAIAPRMASVMMVLMVVEHVSVKKAGLETTVIQSWVMDDFKSI